MGRVSKGGVTAQKRLSYTERRKGVASLYLQGWTQDEMARRFGVSQSTVWRDLQAIQKQWSESALLDFHAARIRELQRIDRLEREAWRGFRRSQRKRERTIQEQRTVGKAKTKAMARREVEKRDGNTDWLATIRWCVEQRCKILGLYEAAKLEVSHDWRERVEPEHASLAEAFFAQKAAELAEELEERDDLDG